MPITNIEKHVYAVDDNHTLVCFLSPECEPCGRVKPVLDLFMRAYTLAETHEFKLEEAIPLRMPSGTKVVWIDHGTHSSAGVLAQTPFRRSVP